MTWKDRTPQLATLGDRLQAAREAAGLTRIDAARRGGYAQVTVRNVEQGASDYPSEQLVRTLAGLYGMPLDETDALLALLDKVPSEIAETWRTDGGFREAVRKLHRKTVQRPGEPYPSVPITTVRSN